MGATAGILLAGFVSDLLIRRGFSMSSARKAPLITGTLLASAIVLVNYLTSDAAIIAIFTVAFFAQGIAASSWAAVSEVAPRQFIGLTSGITSLAANLAGVSTPLAIGYILQATGSFYWALNFLGSFASLERFRIRCYWEDSIELKWSRQETLDDYATQHSDVLTGLLTFLGVILKLIATKRHERCAVRINRYCI